FFGIITCGLGFALYAIFIPATALVYNALTLGGTAAATWGMQLTGLRLIRKDGSAPDLMYGGLHAFLYYLSVAILTPFVALFSFINQEKRLLHDMILGGVVVRANPVD
ncbi:MAG: RDD family protein, partial [Pseudomonadota bacterium]